MRIFSETEAKSIAHQRWGIKLAGHGKELHGPCPNCVGGRDRFIVWLEGGNYFCRQCLSKGWLEERQKGWKPDPEAAAKMAAWVHQQAEEERVRLTAWQAGYAAGYAQGWHDAMEEKHRAFWESQGVHKWAYDFYGMGYCKEREFFHDKEAYKAPAYTIPIYEPKNWDLVNIQYRVAGPLANQIGKYRQEYNIPAAAFYAEPHTTEGVCVALEGAKKAVVIYELLGFETQVVGWPSMTPAETLIEQLRSFERVYLCLDPVTPGSPPRGIVNERVARLLPGKLFIMSMGVKPDDAVTQYGMTRPQFESIMRQAWKV